MPAERVDRPGVCALVLGLFFAVLYAFFLYFFPRLPGEFSYVPVMQPLPFAAMGGFTFEQLLLHLGRLALLGPALVFLGLALRAWLPALAPDERRLRAWLVLGGACSLLVSTVVLARVLAGEAIVDDELTYRDQAMLLADGRLAHADLPWVGIEPFTIRTERGMTGKYLFGEPLLQIPGALVGLPGLLHLPLAALTLWAWFLVVRARAGFEVAAWATLALALSPMFMLTNGTGLSHTASLAAVVVAGLGLTWSRAGRPVAGALLAANALGLGFVVRPQVAVPVGAVLGGVLLLELARARRPAALAAFAATALAWMALVGWYDARLTGSALRLPWALYPTSESLGFNADYTPLDAVLHLLVSLVRFNGWWLGFPLGLALVALWVALGRPAAGLRLWGACGLALVALNVCYLSPGISETGPVYYFELLLPASLIAAHAWVGALRRWPRLATAMLATHLVLGTGTFVVEQAARLARLRQAIHGRSDAVLASLERPALLIHESRYAENVSPGWVFSYPLRLRSERDAVVTFPRHSPDQVRALRARYADRHCYYTRVEPTRHRTEVTPCEQAEALLARPEDAGDEGPGTMPAPTAGRLGYFPLIPGFHLPW